MDIFNILYQSSPFLLAISIAILVVNILLVLVVVGAGWYAWRHILSLHKQIHSEERGAEVNVERIIIEAQTQATNTVRDAAQKAQELLRGASTVKDDSLRSIMQEVTAVSEQHQRYLKDASLKYVETYEHMAERAQEEYLATLHTASQGMARDASQTLHMFESYLKEQTVGYKQEMEKKIEGIRKETNEYVTAYKKEKLQRVDKSIDEVIIAVAKNVIGRSISLKEHHELVLHALDKAKKESFFSHLDL